MDLPIVASVHIVISFLEYLYQNSISPKIIATYLSSIQARARFYHWDTSAFSQPSVGRYICSITINSSFTPVSRDIFNIRTLCNISISCDLLSDPLLYRAIFLMSFYGFLRMSYIAPHSAKKFDQNRHFLRKYIIFAPPGVHILIKWTKTVQDNKAHHWVQLPQIKKPFLCPVKALKALLESRLLPTSAPLFANNFQPYGQVTDTHIRDSLKKILAHRNIPLKGHGFYTFRRSGVTLAFDNNI